MSELQDTADHLVVVGRGRVVADTSVSELLARASGGRVVLRTSAAGRALGVLERTGGTVVAPIPARAPGCAGSSGGSPRSMACSLSAARPAARPW
jgi:hypothetical protein